MLAQNSCAFVLQRAISVSAQRNTEFYNSSRDVVKDIPDEAKLLVGGIPPTPTLSLLTLFPSSFLFLPFPYSPLHTDTHTAVHISLHTKLTHM